jgi:hypothetical protein
MKRKLFIFCLLLVLPVTGCKKPKLVRIEDLPEKVVAVSIWDCDGIGENGQLRNPKKTKENSNPEMVALVRNAVAELKTIDATLSPCMNLLCFTTEDGKNYCIDIDFGDPLFGTLYIDTKGKLREALNKAGLMPVPYKPCVNEIE